MIACPVCAAENPDGLRLCAQCGTALAIPGQPTPATPATRRRSAPTVVLPPELPARLLVSTPEWSREFTLAKDTVTVGREADNDIVIEAEAVSRHHAIIKRRGPAFLIMDVGSTNGLNVDGKRVEEMLLASGDCVCVGHSVTLEYRGPETLATDTAAAALAGPLPGGQVAGAARATVTPEAPVYEVREGHSLILGRGDETGVHMAHPQVSERHAEVRRKADQYVIRDLGSSTGTYVNGQLVSQQVLRENDVIRVGPNRLVFQGGRLRLVIDEGGLRLDACHLGRVVGKGQRILQDVSLSIKPQEFVAVVGGSRTGKSTLIKALTGFEPATEGAVLLNGVDLYGNFDAYRNEMGHVPQDDVTPLDLPVSRALVYAARLRMPADTTRQEREQRVNEVIDELELRGCADRAIRRLSGGQRKRVSIGVELLTRPSLFFLDEVTSGLDPATEVQMMNLLRRLADQGRTIILTTRATKNVMACDKMAVLVRGGRLAYFGPPKEALDYFGVEEFDEIHAKLESQASPEEWAQRFLSSTISDRLPVAHLSDRSRVLATVLFTDIVGSTQTAVELGDSAWRRLLDRHNDHVRRELKRFGGKVVNSAGDGFLATFDSPARAVKCAQAVCAAVKPLGLDVRVGCHTGEIELLGADVGGIAVHIGARVVALAGPCEVLASSTVKDLAAGSGLVFEDRGEHELKGVPGRWRLYAVGH